MAASEARLCLAPQPRPRIPAWACTPGRSSKPADRPQMCVECPRTRAGETAMGTPGAHERDGKVAAGIPAHECDGVVALAERELHPVSELANERPAPRAIK